jgi:hypothetical protein
MSNIRTIASELDVSYPRPGVNNTSQTHRDNTNATQRALNLAHDELTTIQNLRFNFIGDAAGQTNPVSAAVVAGGQTRLDASLTLASVLAASVNLDSRTQDMTLSLDVKGRVIGASPQSHTMNLASGHLVNQPIAFQGSLGLGSGQVQIPSYTFNGQGRLTATGITNVAFGIRSHIMTSGSILIGDTNNRSVELAPPGAGSYSLSFQNGQPTWVTGGTVYTDEQSRDAVGAALRAQSGLGWNVDDAGDTITLVVSDATVFRTAIGLGTSATRNTGTTGATIPLLNTANSWAGAQTFTTTLATTQSLDTQFYLNVNGGKPLINLDTADSLSYDRDANLLKLTIAGTDVLTWGTQGVSVQGKNLTELYEAKGILAGIATKTTNYSLVLTDVGQVIEMNLTTANTLTIPASSAINFPIGSRIDLLQLGTGQTTITPSSGVTVRSVGGKLKLTTQYSGASLYKRALDEWVIMGDLVA